MKDAVLKEVISDELITRMHILGAETDAVDVTSWNGSTPVTRTLFSHSWWRAANLIKIWMEEAGLEARIDEIGNVRGRTPNHMVENKTKDNRKALLLGSHFDSVIDGGKYDGTLGILSAIQAVKALININGNNSDLPFLYRPIEVIAFGDEVQISFFFRDGNYDMKVGV